MSLEELRRVEVLAGVRSKQLRVVDASRLMHVSYRQAKRLWKRYREEGAAGLKHRGAGRASNRGYPAKFRQRVLALLRVKYGVPLALYVDWTSGRPRRPNSCGEKSRSRSLGACAGSWGSS